MTKDDYNKEEVHCCNVCLSLAIKEMGNSEIACCIKCGNTSLLTTDIDNWDYLYKRMYGKDYLNGDKQ